MKPSEAKLTLNLVEVNMVSFQTVCSSDWVQFKITDIVKICFSLFYHLYLKKAKIMLTRIHS